MQTIQQAVGAEFVMDYDNIPGKGPLILFKRLEDRTMTLATPEHIVDFVKKHNAIAGIDDPSEFMSLVRELCDGIADIGINNVGQNVMMLKDKLVAMLPNENDDGK